MYHVIIFNFFKNESNILFTHVHINTHFNMVFKCTHCSKEFKQKASYTKHTLLCAAPTVSKPIVNNVDDMEQISFKQLVEIVQSLNRRIAVLEDRLSKTECTVNKRGSICKWMSDHMIPHITFDEWKISFNATQEDALCALKNGMTLAIIDMITRRINNLNNGNANMAPTRTLVGSCNNDGTESVQSYIHPMCSFDNKPGVIWIYRTEWKSATPSDIREWVSCLGRKLMEELMKWKREKKRNESETQMFNDTSLQIIELNNISSDIKTHAYNMLKREMPIYVWDSSVTT